MGLYWFKVYGIQHFRMRHMSFLVMSRQMVLVWKTCLMNRDTLTPIIFGKHCVETIWPRHLRWLAHFDSYMKHLYIVVNSKLVGPYCHKAFLTLT